LRADIYLSLIFFLMPILNVLVIGVLSSPCRGLKLAFLVGNMVWLGLACWLVIDRYPSHPKETGLVTYVALMELTPLLSAVTIFSSGVRGKQAGVHAIGKAPEQPGMSYARVK
jgi:hypothetical protein